MCIKNTVLGVRCLYKDKKYILQFEILKREENFENF